MNRMEQRADFDFNALLANATPEGELQAFPLCIGKSVSNSRLSETFRTLESAIHGSANRSDWKALQPLLECFSPVSDKAFINKPQPEHPNTLWDQIGDAYYYYNSLPKDQQANVRSITELLVWSIANSNQERKIKGVVRDVSPHVREQATHLLDVLESWKDAPDAKVISLPSRSAITKRVATAVGAVALLLAACGKPAQPTITPEATTPGITQPYQTTEAPGTVSPTETPPSVIIGNMPDVPALSGLEPGLGGAGELITNPFTDVLLQAINTARFGVVHAGGTVSVESQHNGVNLCFTPIPAELYNPDFAPEGEQLKGQQNGVASYEFTKVLAEVPTPADSNSVTYACALGYALSDNPDFQPGTLRMLLVRTNADGSIDIVGSRQAGFNINDDVNVLDDTVYVNGKKQEWTLYPGMTIEIPTLHTIDEGINELSHQPTQQELADLSEQIFAHHPDIQWATDHFGTPTNPTYADYDTYPFYRPDFYLNTAKLAAFSIISHNGEQDVMASMVGYFPQYKTAPVVYHLHFSAEFLAEHNLTPQKLQEILQKPGTPGYTVDLFVPLAPDKNFTPEEYGYEEEQAVLRQQYAEILALLESRMVEPWGGQYGQFDALGMFLRFTPDISDHNSGWTPELMEQYRITVNKSLIPVVDMTWSEP